MYCVGKGPTARSKKPNNKSQQNLVHRKYLMLHNTVYTKAWKP
jgi:CRISPR/Cas system-associated protein endoribonuclease Cas2